MTEQDFFELRSLLAIAHHIPGRIRLKIDPKIRDHPSVHLLEKLAKGAGSSGIFSVRLNILAHSVVIEYDSSIINPETFDIFLGRTDPGEIRRVAQDIAGLFGTTLPPPQGEHT